MDFDPYLEWLRIPPDRRPPSHYDLLGLPRAETDSEQIREAAENRYDHVKKYTLPGPLAEHANRLLTEISRALNCLTDPKQKEAYDRQLQGDPLPATGSTDSTADEPATQKPPAAPEERPRTPARQTPAGAKVPSRRPSNDAEIPTERLLPTAARPTEGEPRSAPAVEMALGWWRLVDDRLQALAGRDRKALHNVFRAAAVLLAVLVPLGLVWLAAGPGGSEGPDLASPEPVGPAPLNPEDVEKARQQEERQKNEVFQAWSILYERQRAANPWPAELGNDFRDGIASLGPEGEIPIDFRERYQHFAVWNFPRLYEIVDIRLEPTRDENGEIREDAAGKVVKVDPFKEPEEMGGFGGSSAYGGMGSGYSSTATSWNDQLVGKVSWNLTDLKWIRDGFSWATRPTSVQVRFAQEDLWIYEALLRCIRQTNELATRHDNAVVKRIEALEVGRRAAAAFALWRGQIVDPGDGMGFDGGGGAGYGEEGMAGTGMLPAGSIEEHLKNGRYLGQDGMPLAATDREPWAEFKMVPVRMRLLVDQRRISSLLVNCVNLSMPIEIRHVIFNPGEGQSTGLGGLNSYDMPIEILGVAYVFNPPDRDQLGRGAARSDIGQVGARLVASVDGRTRWLELLRLVNAALPKDDPAERPEEIMLRNELHVAGLRSRRMDKLEDWHSRLRSQDWYQATSANEDGRSGSTGAGSPGTGPQGPGWVIELTGYHYHNHEPAGPSQGAQFVRDTLIRGLQTETIAWPVPGGAEGGVEPMSAADLGVGYAILIDPGTVERETVADPNAESASDAEDALVELRRFDFVVQCCWQPTASDRRRPGATEVLSYAQRTETVKTPVEEAHYVHSTPWDPPLFAGRRKRGEPQHFALRDLRAVGGHGAVQMSGGPTGPSPARGTRGQRWIVVTGLLPSQSQTEAFEVTFEDTEFRAPQRDVPAYLGYRIERAEVDGHGEAELLRWKQINSRRALEIQRTYGGGGATEVVHGSFLPNQSYGAGAFSMVFPLPPLVNGTWGPEVAHRPEIPLLADMSPAGPLVRPRHAANEGEGDADEDEGAFDSPFERGGLLGGVAGMSSDPYGGSGMSASPYGGSGMSYGGRDEMDYGASGVSNRDGMGGYSGLTTQGENRAPAEYQLFRFLDFNVEPGRRYRYRVQLVLANPNYGVNARYLEDEALAKSPWIATEWSDPTDVASAPPDSRLLVGSVTPSSSLAVEPTANVIALTFRMEDGLMAAHELAVSRGQLADFEAPIRLDRERGIASMYGGTYGDEEDELGYASGFGPPGMGSSMQGTGRTADSGRRPRRRASKAAEEETEKISHATGLLLLDMAGGGRLDSADRSLTEPGSLLLVDSGGNLVVRNELDDLTEFMAYHVPEEKKPPRYSKRSSKNEKMPGMEGGYGDYGDMEEMYGGSFEEGSRGGGRRGSRRSRGRKEQ